MKKFLNLIATILMLNIVLNCEGTFVYTIDGDDLAVNKPITQSVARENQNKTLFCHRLVLPAGRNSIHKKQPRNSCCGK